MVDCQPLRQAPSLAQGAEFVLSSDASACRPLANACLCGMRPRAEMASAATPGTCDDAIDVPCNSARLPVKSERTNTRARTAVPER